MSAYYLSKRHEEEEAQRRAVQEQVAAKNEALRAQEAQQREQAKIENYQQGKAMLNEALANSGLSQAEQDAIRAQAQTNGMTAGLNLTAAAVTAQQARYEVDNAWLAQADKSESERLEDIQKSPEYQAREIERLAILNWIKTGENPPPSMMDKTEDERLAMYKDTYAYQSQQASLAAWQAEEEERQRQSAILAAIREMEPDKKSKEEYLGQNKDRELIRDKYLELFYQRSKGMNDVDALSNLALFAAAVTPDNTTYFVDNMGSVITGYSGSNPSIQVFLHRNNRIDLDRWYESLKYGGNFLLQKGYDPIFKDKEGKGNQGRHFWFYVQVGYHEGMPWALTGNAYHETIDPFSDTNEKSFQDYALGVEGAKLGVKLADGSIKTEDVGQYILDTLSNNSSTANSWRTILDAIKEPVVFPPQSWIQY